MQAQEGDKVERVRPEDIEDIDDGGGEKRQGGGLRQLLFQAGISLAVTFVVLFFWAMPQMVTKDDFDKNIGSMVTDIASLKSSVSGIGTLGTQLSQISSNINSVNAEVASLRTSLGNYATSDKITSLNSSLGSIQQSISALQNDLNTVKGSVSGATASVSQIATLQTTLNTLSTKIATLEITVKDLKDDVGGLSGGISSNGTAIVSGKVTILVTGNPWTNSQMVNFSAIGANSSSTNQFVFEINNGLDKTITNIRLAIGLELLDANSNPLNNANGFPTGVSATVSSSGLIWVSQNTGYPYILGFTNSTPSGIFGSIGLLDQDKGSAGYTVTVTVINTTNNILPAFNIYPIVKIISYS